MILTHNAADGVTPESWGSLSWLWKILHVQSRIQLAPDVTFGVAYPLIPWVGVMAAGYSFGHFFRMEAHRRQRLFLILGTSLIAGFLLLRFTNWYGDANPWSSQKSPIFTVMSFVNCRKYPPSLLYLLMTLGPGIVILSRVDRGVPRFLNGIVVFGKVPMFYYLLHLPLLHFSALILMRISGQPYDWMFKNDTMPPPGAGFGLPVIYVAWACAILILYPLCRWFAGVKQRNRSEWLSYF